MITSKRRRQCTRPTHRPKVDLVVQLHSPLAVTRWGQMEMWHLVFDAKRSELSSWTRCSLDSEEAKRPRLEVMAKASSSSSRVSNNGSREVAKVMVEEVEPGHHHNHHTQRVVEERAVVAASEDAKATLERGQEQAWFHASTNASTIFDDFPDADVLYESKPEWRFDPLLAVTAACFVEIFSGSGILTLALTFLCLPALRPWDSASGPKYDVLKEGFLLEKLALLGYLSGTHLGTPCISFSWSRTPQVRGLRYLMGYPWLNERQQRQVDDGNNLAEWSFKFCMIMHSVGCYFSLENPFPSWIWCLAWARALWSMPGVCFFLITFQSYGTPWYKLTGLLTNLPTGRWLDIGETNEKCRVQLRGTFTWKGEEIMKTSVAAEYPVEFGHNYAVCFDASLEMKQAAIERGDPVPMSDKKLDCGALNGALPWELEPGVIEDMEYLACPDIKCPYVTQGQ